MRAVITGKCNNYLKYVSEAGTAIVDCQFNNPRLLRRERNLLTNSKYGNYSLRKGGLYLCSAERFRKYTKNTA